jgi:hypothetical protein
LFADAEFDRVMEIDQQQCDAILQLIDQTLKTKARIP